MDWDNAAHSWEDEPSVRAYARMAFTSLERELARRGVPMGGERALDFGCGTGLLTQRLQGQFASIDAVDTSAAMLEVLDAKVSGNGWSNVSASEGVPEGGGPYDLVVCSSVLAFVDDYPGTVATLSKRLADGGLLVQWDWELDPDSPEPFGLTRVEMVKALGDAGLADVDVKVAFTLGGGSEVMAPLMGSGVRRS